MLLFASCFCGSSAWRAGAARLKRALLIALGLSVVALGFVSGCNRVVLVDSGSPVRIGPHARARVYALVDGEWQLSDNAAPIPEGWYLVPPEFVEDTK